MFLFLQSQQIQTVEISQLLQLQRCFLVGGLLRRYLRLFTMCSTLLVWMLCLSSRPL